MTEFRMPSLGADMEDGTLVQWLKAPGDRLTRGDIIAVVETQKGAIEIEVFHDGVLEEAVAKPGARLPVGAVMAIIREEGEATRETPPSAVPVPAPAPAAAIAAAIAAAAPGAAHLTPRSAPLPGIRITPAARREAERLHLDQGLLTPGPDGIIGLRDLGLVPPAPRPKAAGFTEMRKAIGAAMARGKREIPHYYVTSLLDLSKMMAWLSRMNAERPPAARLLPLAPILKACALGLTQVRELNGHHENERFTPADMVKMGVGIAMRGGGLIAPAIDRVESLALDDIMDRLRDLTLRVRGGRLKSSELSGATITLSSLGEGSADALLPIIYPPQVASIGMGQIAARPWAVDGGLCVRMTASFSVAGDHRVSDGRSAARFLTLLQSRLDAAEGL